MDERALIDARPVPGTTCRSQWMVSVISAVTVTRPSSSGSLRQATRRR